MCYSLDYIKLYYYKVQNNYYRKAGDLKYKYNTSFGKIPNLLNLNKYYCRNVNNHWLSMGWFIRKYSKNH